MGYTITKGCVTNCTPVIGKMNRNTLGICNDEGGIITFQNDYKIIEFNAVENSILLYSINA